MYEAYVKSKLRYKIYLATNDVTSVLYVSLVRQFETLLFYVVTSRIKTLVSRHKLLNACVEKVYHLLFFGTHLAQSFWKCWFLVTIRCTVFRDTFGGKIRPYPWRWIASFRGFSPQSAVRDGESRHWGDRCVCRHARYLNNFQIAYTIVEPYCHSSLLLHRTHTLACEYRLVGYSWPVEIGWLHGSHSRRDCRCAFSSFTNSNLLLLLATASKT